MEDGYDVIESPVPALISVVKEINTPRMPSLRGMMKAKKAEIKKLSAEDIKADVKKIGLTGSPTQVLKIFSPPGRTGGVKLEGTPQEIAESLVSKLKETKLI